MMVEQMPVGLAVGDRSQGYEVTGAAQIVGLPSAYLGKDTRQSDTPVSLIWLSEDQDQSALFGLTHTYEDLQQHALIAPRTVVRFGGGSAAVIGKEQGAPLESETLERWMSGRPALPLSQAITMLEPIMLGLKALHERGLAHGLLSGQHVLVDTQGHARLLPPLLPHGAEASMAAKAMQAPELVSGGTADPVSDVYSLSVLLRWLISGTQPVSADERLASKARHDKDPLLPVTETAPGLTPDLATFLDGAMRLHPATRPQNIGAMLAALEPHKETIAATSQYAPPPLEPASQPEPSPWAKSDKPSGPPPLPSTPPRQTSRSGGVPPIPKTTRTIGEAPPLPTTANGQPPRRQFSVKTVITFIVAGAVAWFVASGGFFSNDEAPSPPSAERPQSSQELPRKGPSEQNEDQYEELEEAFDDLDDDAPSGVLEQFCNSRFTFETARDAGSNALRAYLEQCEDIDSDFVDAARRALR